MGHDKIHPNISWDSCSWLFHWLWLSRQCLTVLLVTSLLPLPTRAWDCEFFNSLPAQWGWGPCLGHCCRGLQGAITKHHSNRYFFPPSPRGWKSKVKALADLVPSKGSLLGSLLVDGWLLAVHPPWSFLHPWVPDVSLGAQISSYEDTSPTGWGPPEWPHFNLLTSFEGPVSKYSPILMCQRLGIQCTNFGEARFGP